MSDNSSKTTRSDERPQVASKKPRPAVKSDEREARLAEALRENLRRRKARTTNEDG